MDGLGPSAGGEKGMSAHPVRERGVGIFVALALALLALMPAWRWMATSLPQPESYALPTADFVAKLDAMISRYGTGEKTEDGGTVVRPPPGDIYLSASRWRFDPMLELEVNKTYRLHVASVDVLHGFNFPLGGADLLLEPGKVFVMTVKAAHPGPYAMQCSEYCGLNHSRMKGLVRVIPLR